MWGSNFVLLVTSKINRPKENCGRREIWQRVVCCYLNLSTARRGPTSLSSVSLPITRSEMPDPWPPLFLRAIYLSPAIAYSIAREPLARSRSCDSREPHERLAVCELVPHPRFVRLSSCVSRSCPGKPYFGPWRYFNELIVIGTLSRSHESFLWYGRDMCASRGPSTKCHAA